MNDIICEATTYYSATPTHRNTFRILFRLTDTVDGDLLQQAAALAFQRYPYYAVRCCADEREYRLVPHDAPFVVRHTAEPIDVGGEASNGYLLAVSYWEDKIWVNVFHGLTDGSGLMSFSRTLLYYYCRARYDANLPADGIRVLDDPISPEEWENPYIQIMSGERVLPDESDILIQVKPDTTQPAFNLFEDPRITKDEPEYFHIRIPEKEMMQYCRAQDGTPGVVISLLMSRAIDRLNPENTRPIVTGMAVNLRPALDAPLYKGSPLALAYLPYGGRIKEKSFGEQATIYRGRLLLAADKERLQAGINSSKRLYAAIYQIPTLEGKRQFVHQVIGQYMGTATFQVSYMGPARLGAMDPYVIETQLQDDCNSITIEVMAAHGSFFLEFTQQWKEDLYFRAFCDELSALGIQFEIMDHGPHKVPNIELP